ncbi:MAG: hypothetical protein R3F07_11645 [Opitutaceae bacterium]
MKSTPTRQIVRTCARVVGIRCLMIITAAIFAQVLVRLNLTIPGDVPAMVANILGSALILRAGIAAELVGLLRHVALAGTMSPVILLSSVVVGASHAPGMMIKAVGLRTWRSWDDRQALYPIR